MNLDNCSAEGDLPGRRGSTPRTDAGNGDWAMLDIAGRAPRRVLPEPLFIFELANNHMGDVEHGLRVIAEFGALAQEFDFSFAFKLQFRELESFIHPAYKNRTDIKYIKRFSETRLDRGETRRLVDAIKANGFLAMCTPFDEASVDRIVEDGFDVTIEGDRFFHVRPKEWDVDAVARLLEAAKAEGASLAVLPELSLPAPDALEDLIGQSAEESAYQIAEVYALRRDPTQMFAWLDRAWTNRDPGIRRLALDPFIAPYHGDPRFDEFRLKVGLPALTRSGYAAPP